MDDVNICWYPHTGGARSRTLNSKESPAQPAVAGARAQRFRDLRLSHSFVLLLQWVLIDAFLLKLMRLSVSPRFLPRLVHRPDRAAFTVRASHLLTEPQESFKFSYDVGFGSKCEIVIPSRCFPLYPRKRTQVGHCAMTVSCQ